ncbi:MAG: hypothetical protein IKC91_02870 [Clostridia bacterium]|nr:hypothetical protein [Clostridia bacterium]
MNEIQKNTKEEFTIDLKHVFKTILHRIWFIVLAGVLAAGTALLIAMFVITPKFAASIRFYVNAAPSSGNNSNITSSQIDASQKLIDTYKEILNSRPTYQRIIEETDLDYTPEELSKLIVAGSANQTEVMYVTVTTTDPQEAADIANSIAHILPDRISQVIKGSSVEIIEEALPNSSRVSPSRTKYTLVGLLLGVLISTAIVVILAIMDNTVHDENYMLQTYQYPMLAKIPNLSQDAHSKRYGYYQKYGYENNEKIK